MTPSPSNAELLDMITELRDELERKQRAPGPVRVRRAWRRRHRYALAIVTLAGLLALPVGALANHAFTDVPTTNPYHASIARLKGAAITAGCSATTYCPEAPVTRGQMAAFLVRTGGRVDAASFTQSAVSFGGGLNGLAAIEVKAGDVTGGTAYIAVQVDVQGEIITRTGCPCVLEVGLYDENIQFIEGTKRYVPIDSVGNITAGSTSFSRVIEVPTGITMTYWLEGRVAAGSTAWLVDASVMATTIPFAGDGSNP
jgi:hypothetical protein